VGKQKARLVQEKKRGKKLGTKRIKKLKGKRNTIFRRKTAENGEHTAKKKGKEALLKKLPASTKESLGVSREIKKGGKAGPGFSAGLSGETPIFLKNNRIRGHELKNK